MNDRKRGKKGERREEEKQRKGRRKGEGVKGRERWRERGRQEVHSKARVDILLIKNVSIVKRGTSYDRNNNMIHLPRKGYMEPSLLQLFWRQPMVAVNVKNQVSLS